MVKSALYEGFVRHRRHRPVPHAFRYRLFMMYLDLAELPGVLDRYWCWSARRPALAWFRRADYLGDPAVDLDHAVRDRIEAEVGRRPSGPIRMLTHLRYFGYVMNPVTFYYASDAADTRVETIVAEITNTPWNERHSYVLAGADPAPATGRSFRLDKTFHVSPFMDMDHEYRWRFSAPEDRLSVHMENWVGEDRVFDATLALERRELGRGVLASNLARHPFVTAKVAGAIYWQAARLWAKRVPFFVHPSKREDPA